MTMTLRSAALALVLLLALSAPAAALSSAVDTLAFLGQRVLLSTGGDAMLTETAVLAQGGPGLALLPFGYERADSFTVQGRDAAFAPGAAGARAALRVQARRKLLAIELGPAAAAGDTLVVRCRLRRFVDWSGVRGEFAAYSLAGGLVNDSDVNLGVASLTLVMPPGYQVRRVTATEPVFKAETSPTPPYAVGVANGRSFAVVKAPRVRPGGRVRIALQAERADRGRVPLLAGLLVAALYLWFFRDLPATRRLAAAASQRSNGSQ